MGSVLIVAICNVATNNVSVQCCYGRAITVPCAVRSSHETFRTAPTTRVKGLLISEDFRQILSFWKELR
jgi:hypothetical protein